jgi:diadenylate cyclase
VVAVVGRRPEAFPDMLLVVAIETSAVQPTLFGEVGSGRIAPAVFDAVVELAVELGIEGWEGHALGTMFVVGDVPRVMTASRQLALNPFKGYSEAERNLVDPTAREVLRSFATLDGAFVVREDGVVEAAGRYLEFAACGAVEIPLGLGARHTAAALATTATDAIAVVVSQATGKVRVFRHGAVVLELTPSHRRT